MAKCLVMAGYECTMAVGEYHKIMFDYCMSGRTIWGNVQLEGGSTGPTEGNQLES